MQPIPSNILAELNEPFVLTAQQKAFFTKNGFIKIKQVFSKEVLDFMDTEISKEVSRLNKQHLDMKDRDTYGKAFLQIMNLWCNSEVVKEIVMGKRLAKIATELLNVSGVRIYHDQALYKEPSGGHTPWHADQYYWPLSNDRTVTAWIPLQATPLSLGPLEFCAESFQLSEGRDKKISDESEAFLEQTLANAGYEHVIEAFDLGEVSFHLGWLYHRAGPNLSSEMRKVMTMIYIDKEVKLQAPKNDNQQADWDAWCPGAKIGEVVNTPLNPVVYE
ncbi:MAG: phytanoyl-CoA dioxygenase family protein [Bacteroidetes bacterium]|jgi:ectoine hydroxylase-related dioxygenase (phytanoyl-CoA dioxygenase family)|nr:phytanoyl-CoA dioxygenase family protein [Bacteroidota bacterium]